MNTRDFDSLVEAISKKMCGEEDPHALVLYGAEPYMVPTPRGLRPLLSKSRTVPLWHVWAPFVREALSGVDINSIAYPG